ncbi:hypothetical protein REC12_20285 [Desulfosporosinus sp. PR]|uniref:right-handed parallel beta-helix repeat-containing protein n=1 Tax=Candidatus Desulfosporosinus nitrosoreducens TaxID=3401928 RepID=UPI0027F48E38|nr:hypothetical protein [Desulfosporosinus sp. PR]MDQ7095936.1 hypothetical protein [Desulfosporosinus sp. PR]
MAIYYVRPDGSNTNTGTGYLAAQAWATISKAASVMVAGDTCYIAPGTYRETVTVANSGSSGSYITFWGDRKCQYFLDMSPGDVIISGLNAETDTVITRGQAINASSKNYINLTNIDIENQKDGNYVIQLGSNCNISNCNLIKGISATSGGAIYILANCSVMNSKICSLGYIFYFSGLGNIVTNCILKSKGSSALFSAPTTSSIEFDHCIIDSSYTSSSAGIALKLYGCIWNLNPGYAGSVGCSLYSNSASFTIDSRGTIFIGNSSAINLSCTTSFLGTLVKDIYNFSAGMAAVNATFSYSQFENCQNPFYSTVSGMTLSNCYFKNNDLPIAGGGGGSTAVNCRFYGNAQVPGGIILTSPVYGETDVVAGIATSNVNPISGSKSLKIAGYDYGAVFVQWIKCKAGVPKTVTFKKRQNTATAGSYVRFGDQVVNFTNDINIDTVSITYTHHKTELVPMFICSRVNSSGGDFVQYDDIVA